MLRKVLTNCFYCDILILRNAIKEEREVLLVEVLSKLKGRIREKNQSYRSISEMVGMSLSTFNKKVNGNGAFDIIEASKIADILDIPPEEIRLFFT